ncbi:50S ribosomal protein L19 [Candidatus Saccharibacteria bacterium]|nr:50S ribosomal protein L19 [Candidatus Saccharibacteria bacterium]
MNKLASIEKAQLKTKLPSVRVGDTVRVHQLIREGNKQRVQVFEGLAIRYRKVNSLQAFITVRKIASGIGVEKSWFVHSPNVQKIEVVKRSKVRRAVLSYMRERRGKSARMSELEFDKAGTNEADTRTAAQIAAEEQANSLASEAETEAKLDGDAKGKDDALNQADTESLDQEVKQEDKAASKDDPSGADDAVRKGATQEEKVQADGDDEAQTPAEEVQEGLDKAQTQEDKGK